MPSAKRWIDLVNLPAGGALGTPRGSARLATFDPPVGANLLEARDCCNLFLASAVAAGPLKPVDLTRLSKTSIFLFFVFGK
jgi:hypothetical protein